MTAHTIPKLVNRALLLATCVAASLTFAGDSATRELLGFSRDARTFGFLQFGTEDGSGFAWCELVTVEVATNRWAAAPVFVRLEVAGATPERACAEVRRRSARTLRTLGLDRPVRGEHVIHHPLHDVGVPDDTATFSVHRCFFCAGSPRFTVLAERRPVTTAGRCQDLEPGPELLTLTIDGKVLQRDAELPTSRGCASWYRIVDVVLTPLEDRLVVLLATKQPGFEGPNVRFMAVSGTLPAPVDGGVPR